VAPADPAEFEVLAAGGLVLRGAGDAAEVAVVHRPKYDDWSLPKGKLDPGESFEQGALREVLEETGFRCELAGRLEPTSYRDRKGRTKLVRYYLMRPLGGAFAPSDEVDELRWVPPGEAGELLTHTHDRRLVAGVLGP